MRAALPRLAAWVAATLLGTFLGVAMLQFAVAAVGPSQLLLQLPDPLLLAAYAAAFVAAFTPGLPGGALQALALPARDGTTRVVWAIVTGVGAWIAGAVGALGAIVVLALFLLMDPGPAAAATVSLAVGVAAGGAVLGAAQTLVMPDRRRWGGWVVASALGGLAAGVLFGLAETVGWELLLRLAGKLGQAALLEKLAWPYTTVTATAAALPYALLTGRELARAADPAAETAPVTRPRLPPVGVLALVGAAVVLFGGTCVALVAEPRAQAGFPNAPPWPPAAAGTWETIVGDAQPNRPAAIALDAVGNVYVADPGRQRLHKLSPSLQPLAEWGREGPAPGELNTPQGVALDAQGSVYVAEAFNFRVQRFDARGQSTGTWSGPEGFQPAGLAFDPQGNLLAADQGSHAIVRLRPADGPGARWTDVLRGPGDRLITSPRALAVDRDGTIFVAEPIHGRVRKVGPDGRDLALWATVERHPAGWIGPSGLALDAQGVLHVADPYTNRIVRVDRDGRVLGELGPAAGLREPVDVALDAFGDLYVAEALGYGVRKLAPDGRELASWGTGPPIVEPSGMAIDAAGNLYLPDRRRGHVVKLSPAGQVLARLGQIDGASSVGLDRDGNLYVAGARDRVVKLDPAGRVLESRLFRSPGPLAVGPDGGLIVADRTGGRLLRRAADGAVLDPIGDLADPVAVAVDAEGNLFVAEAGRAATDSDRRGTAGSWPRVRKLSADGQYLASWAPAGSDSLRGPHPIALAAAPDGGVYVALAGWPHLVKLSDVLTPVAHWGGEPAGDDDWPLSSTAGLAADAQGRVYVADYEGRVKRLTPR